MKWASCAGSSMNWRMQVNMHEYGVPIEAVRLALALGVIISILVYERWRLTGGAAVVAGYLALFVNRPLYIFTTILVSLLTYIIVDRVIARRMFLYGRRRVVMMVIVGMFLQLFTGAIAYFARGEALWLTGLYGVGYVLPGLIAQDIERQGVKSTLLTVLGTSLLTFFLFYDLMAIKTSLPLNWSSIPVPAATMFYSYHTRFLTLAVIISVFISALLFEWTGIRSGGFLSAAYLALFVLAPQHILFITLVGVLVYFFVKYILMRLTPIFGRSKFAMMVLTGLVFTWVLEFTTGALTNHAFIPFAGFSVISPMIAALIANDSERQGLSKTLVGVGVCTILVFVAVKGVDLLLVG
jgi:poly-gamma-glutamate biosynthesis protein PgsC/CapC